MVAEIARCPLLIEVSGRRVLQAHKRERPVTPTGFFNLVLREGLPLPLAVAFASLSLTLQARDELSIVPNV